MSIETAAILEQAANVIRRNGWHQGSFCAVDILTAKPKRYRACCARGAINLAANGHSPEKLSDVGEAAHDALCRQLGISGNVDNSVADWNDAADRTAEQVIAALEGAARAEREAAS